jgi:hypothetical protein
MQTRNSIITGVITSAMADYYLHLMTIFSRKLGSEPVGRLEVLVRAVGSVEPAMANCQTLSEQNGNKHTKRTTVNHAPQRKDSGWKSSCAA